MIEINNFLSDRLNRHYENILFHGEFPWYYADNITNSPTHFNSYPIDYKQYGFHHTCFMEYESRSSTLSYFTHLVEMVKDQLPENPEGHDWELFRVRCGFNLPLSPVNKRYASLDHNQPHVDHDNRVVTGKTLTCLYYVNDTDGDTFIFNEKLKPAPSSWPAKFTVKTRVNPSRNKLLIFDGDHFHASSSPTEYESRLVLTFNFHDRRYQLS
jgi:hypothetical protein